MLGPVSGSSVESAIRTSLFRTSSDHPRSPSVPLYGRFLDGSYVISYANLNLSRVACGCGRTIMVFLEFEVNQVREAICIVLLRFLQVVKRDCRVDFSPSYSGCQVPRGPT